MKMRDPTELSKQMDEYLRETLSLMEKRYGDIGLIPNLPAYAQTGISQ